MDRKIHFIRVCENLSHCPRFLYPLKLIYNFKMFICNIGKTLFHPLLLKKNAIFFYFRFSTPLNIWSVTYFACLSIHPDFLVLCYLWMLASLFIIENFEKMYIQASCIASKRAFFSLLRTKNTKSPAYHIQNHFNTQTRNCIE